MDSKRGQGHLNTRAQAREHILAGRKKKPALHHSQLIGQMKYSHNH